MKSGNSQNKHFEKIIFKREIFIPSCPQVLLEHRCILMSYVMNVKNQRELCTIYLGVKKKYPISSNAAITVDYENILKNNKSHVLYNFFLRKYSLFYKLCEALHSCDTVYQPLTPDFLPLPYEPSTMESRVLHDFSKNLKRCNWKMIENTVCYWKDMAYYLSVWPWEIYADKYEWNLQAESVSRQIFQHCFAEKLILELFAVVVV